MEPAKPSFEKRLRLVLLVVVISGILLPVVTFLTWRIRLATRVHTKLTAIAKAGYPVSLADLEQMYYPELKAEENGAVFFTNAFKQPGRTRNGCTSGLQSLI